MAAGKQRRCSTIVCAILAVLVANRFSASACPFCTAVAPSLSQQRESADVFAMAEVADDAKPARFRLHKIVKGAELLESKELLSADVDTMLKKGSLVLLFGTKAENADVGQISALRWNAVTVNETSAAYLLRAPTLRVPASERLRYFAQFLEHADPLVAEDAYREFGHARFDEVAKVADSLSSDRLRAWLASDAVPEARKGFYGLALGLKHDEAERAANAQFLRKQIEAKASDFRAGFDGVIGGYLLLAGTDGLAVIEEQILANPRAAVGDVRHAMTALRFYAEFGRDIPAARLQAAMRKLLARPECAEAAIIDLTRWQAWEACESIAALYDQPAFSEPEIRRAIVGYLRTCPSPKAAVLLADLRKHDPQGIAEAEEVLSKLGRLPQ